MERSLGSKSDIATVQLALSEIQVSVTENGKTTSIKLWNQRRISGKYSVALFSAILRYQKFKGFAETGIVGLNKQTIKALLQDAPGLNKLYITDVGLVSRLDFAKIKLNAEAEARRILLNLASPNKEADALANLIKTAAKAGFQVSAQIDRKVGKDATIIDTQSGRVRVKLAFSYGFYKYPAPENDRFIKSFKKMISNNPCWESVGGAHNHIRTVRSHKFLVSDGVSISDNGLRHFGISRGDYRSDNRYKAIMDAVYKVLRTMPVKSGEAAFDPENEEQIKGTKKQALLLLSEMMLPINESVAKDIIEMVFAGHQEDISTREIFPLYALGFEVAGPFLIVASLGLKIQIIVSPNSKKEYLFIEFSPAVGASFMGSFGMEPLRKSIKDFRSFDVSTFAGAEGELDLGPFQISLKLKAELPKASTPEFFEGGKVSNVFGLGDAAENVVADLKNNNTEAKNLVRLREKIKSSAEKVKEKRQKNSIGFTVFKWDVGILELNVALKGQMKIGRSLEVAAGFRFSAFISIDTKFMDGILYGLVPGSADLEKIQSRPLLKHSISPEEM